VQLRLPMKVDAGYGKTWAGAKGKDKETQIIVAPGNVYSSHDVTKSKAEAHHRNSRLAKHINGRK
jgi:hypothetical protein